MRSDATRALRDRVLTLAYESGGPCLARVRQLPDGPLEVRIEAARPREALERLRFVLAVDDDHAPFLREFASDPLLGERIRNLRGLRPLRTATVAHALLKAVCGQLIQAKTARLLEAKLLRLAAPAHGELRLPPTRATFAGFAPAELVRAGLAARKAATLVRLSRALDVERLHAVSTTVAGNRIERERGLGPWSAGMVCLFGLGRYERGLVGDLGLIRLCSALLGRRAEPEDTARLLEPYGDWAGLASVYLLAGFSKSSAQRNGFSPTYSRSPRSSSSFLITRS
jgi:3-methyladenine DNA glycosylase/8-oxoguanine DNA glycosylase